MKTIVRKGNVVDAMRAICEDSSAMAVSTCGFVYFAETLSVEMIGRYAFAVNTDEISEVELKGEWKIYETR